MRWTLCVTANFGAGNAAPALIIGLLETSAASSALPCSGKQYNGDTSRSFHVLFQDAFHTFIGCRSTIASQ